MNLSADHLFALIVPAVLLLLGSVLVVGWRFLRRQAYMLWLGGGYIAISLPLAAHCLMDNQQLPSWSLACGALYLGGSWASAQGIALRYGKRTSPVAATVIAAATLASLFYFSHITEALQLRILSVNVGMACMLALGAPAVLGAARTQFIAEKSLRACYLVLVLFAVTRHSLFTWMVPLEHGQDLARSQFWQLMLATHLLLNMVFMFLLMAAVLREIFLTLRHERNHDPLTQLLNRRAFFEQAGEAMQRRREQRWALLACDLDHFKQLNDTCGHAAGDEMLAAAGRILVENARHNDLVTRFGGEEFLVLLRCEDLRLARAAAERMRQQLEKARFVDGHHRLTASFGVVLIGPHEGLPAAIKRVDSLLYTAKRRGRNCIEIEQPFESYA